MRKFYIGNFLWPTAEKHKVLNNMTLIKPLTSDSVIVLIEVGPYHFFLPP